MNNEVMRQLATLGHAVWKWRWLAVAVAWPVALVVAVAVSLVPDRFQASAQVFVDTQTVLKPLMAGLAYQPDIDQQLKMLARTLISRPNVERVIDEAEAGTHFASPAAREAEVSRLMASIKVESAGSGNLYAITYRDTRPDRARKLVEAVVDLFATSSTGQKRRDSEDASKFIGEQIQAYEGKLVEAENRLKDFKMRHFGQTGVSDKDYFSRVSALSDEVNRLRVSLSAAEQTREAYQRQLATEDPQLPIEAAAAMPAAPSEIDQRLEAQRKQLDELLRRYTDEHPDVVSARRTIAQLEAQKRQEADARADSGTR
jgi:polysaccharide chain length determinant protein (PEP-CTERM system associated)